MRYITFIIVFLSIYGKSVCSDIVLNNSNEVKDPFTFVYSKNYYYLLDAFRNEVYVYNNAAEKIGNIDIEKAKYFFHDKNEFLEINENPYGLIVNLTKDEKKDEVYLNVLVYKFEVIDSIKEVRLFKPCITCKINPNGIEQIYDFNIPPDYISGNFFLKHGNRIAYESSRRYSGDVYISARELGYSDFDCCSSNKNLDLIENVLSVNEVKRISPNKNFHYSGPLASCNDSSFFYHVYPDLKPIRLYYENKRYERFSYEEMDKYLKKDQYAVKKIISKNNIIAIVLIRVTKNFPKNYLHDELIYLVYDYHKLKFKYEKKIVLSEYKITIIKEIFYKDDSINALVKTQDKKWKIINLEI